MKKTLALLLAFVLIALSLTACGNTMKIQKSTWSLYSVANGDEDIPLDGTLTARLGKLTFKDRTNDKTYTGTYEDRDEFSPTAADYRVSLDTARGRALISVGENEKGETITTLTLLLGDYTLVFLPEKK